MHTSHAAFICREAHRRELLTIARQHELVRQACVCRVRVKPHDAATTTIRALLRHLTPYMAQARVQPELDVAATLAESPVPSTAP
jgi:hypothetical protein